MSDEPAKDEPAKNQAAKDAGAKDTPAKDGAKEPAKAGAGGASATGGGRLTWIAIALVIVGGAVLLYAGSAHLGKNLSSVFQPSAGTRPADAPAIGGPFTLVDQDGKTVTDQDFRGKYMLIYFGYTYCPDVCPTTLTDMSNAMDGLGADADKVVPILITVDPARDTPEHLQEYAGYFHPKLRALTGSAEQIAAVAKAFRVYYAKAKQEEGAEADDYWMDHSSVTYLMGPDGMFRTHFSHGNTAETMVQRIRENF